MKVSVIIRSAQGDDEVAEFEIPEEDYEKFQAALSANADAAAECYED